MSRTSYDVQVWLVERLLKEREAKVRMELAHEAIIKSYMGDDVDETLKGSILKAARDVGLVKA